MREKKLSLSSFLNFSSDCNLSLRTRFCHKMLNVIAKLINITDNRHHYVFKTCNLTFGRFCFKSCSHTCHVSFEYLWSWQPSLFCLIIIIWFEKSLGFHVRSFWTFVSLLLWSVILEPFTRKDASQGNSLVGIGF